MKITENGVALLMAIERARREKKGQLCNLEQSDRIASPRLISLQRFNEIFQLEGGVSERIEAFAKSLNKLTIDEKTIALFFGGSEYISYARKDLQEKGFRNGPAMALLLFHLLLPVKIKREKRGDYSGIYINDAVQVDFIHLKLLCDNENILERGSTFFVRYGYIVKPCEKKIYGPVMEQQFDDSEFFNLCARIGVVDCRKIISPYHYIQK